MFFGPLEDLLILWEQVWLNLSPLSIIVCMSLDIPCQYQLCPLTHQIDLCRDYPHFIPFSDISNNCAQLLSLSSVLTVSFTKFHSYGCQDVDNSTLFRFGHFYVYEMHSDHLQLLWSTYLLNRLYSNNNLLITFRIVLSRDGQIF